VWTQQLAKERIEVSIYRYKHQFFRDLGVNSR
jgi:hypothetical protein